MDASQTEQPENGTTSTQDASLVYKSVVKLAKAIKELQAQDIPYHKFAEPEAGVLLENLQERLLSLTNTVLSKQGLPDTLLYADASQVNDRFDPIVELLDNTYERVDAGLSLVEQSQKKPKHAKHEESASAVLTRVGVNKEGTESIGMVVARNLARPQALFADKVDNGYTTPFVSLVYQLGQKPNAMKPLSEEHLSKFKNVKLYDVTMEMAAALPYPYQFEQDHLVYPESLFQYADPIPPRTLEETPLHMVTDQAGLDAMIRDLKAETEIAIDLEHHDYRSYQGFVCLMQISTRTADYIVDTLLLRRELFSLNEVFTNPAITKVFHGADSDIIWLQRDFGVYVVNMFDTFHASHCLSLSKHSLAYLLQFYSGVSANKEFQLADWRARPLPLPMLEYARSDTHYLLYIFDMMRNELVRSSNPDTLNYVNTTLDNSQITASQRFIKTPYDAENGTGAGGWAKTLEKCQFPLSPRQVAAFRKLHAWRDLRAREEDESVRFILPNHMLFSLARSMPTTTSGVMGCCDPMPIAVRMGAPEIAAFIADIDLEMGTTAPLSSRNIAANNLVVAESTKLVAADLSKQANLPVAASLLGKPFQELVHPTPSTKNFAPVSKLFGGKFFFQSVGSANQEKLLRLALRDQVLANMDFCPLPPTVVIEAQLEDSRIAKGEQTVSSTAAPEGHEFVPVNKNKRPVPKGTVLIPSGHSNSRPQKAEDVITSANVKASISVGTAPIPAAPIEEHDYSNSSKLVAQMTSMPPSKKAKGNQKKNNAPSNPPQQDQVFDPFGAELEKGSGAVKAARSNKVNSAGQSGYSNRSKSFKR